MDVFSGTVCQLTTKSMLQSEDCWRGFILIGRIIRALSRELHTKMCLHQGQWGWISLLLCTRISTCCVYAKGRGPGRILFQCFNFESVEYDNFWLCKIFRVFRRQLQFSSSAIF